LATAAGHADGLDARGAFGAFSSEVAAAWDESFMSTFEPQATQALLADARESVVKAGELLYRGAEHADVASLALIADGLVRTYFRAESGRQVTTRYAWPGDVVGAPAVVLTSFGDQRAHDLWRLYGGHTLHAEALRDTRVLNIAPARFLELAETEATVACALARSLAYLAVEAEQILADGLFLSIRARVARHLMDLAVSRDGVLVVVEGHQEIAEAIGSVREVVSRTLVRLRDDGIVDRRDGETVLLDPAALHAIAAAG
jgi:CRP/FNR family transcriptional regulator, cyclic AMP receptor protein